MDEIIAAILTQLNQISEELERLRADTEVAGAAQSFQARKSTDTPQGREVAILTDKGNIPVYSKDGAWYRFSDDSAV